MILMIRTMVVVLTVMVVSHLENEMDYISLKSA